MAREKEERTQEMSKEYGIPRPTEPGEGDRAGNQWKAINFGGHGQHRRPRPEAAGSHCAEETKPMGTGSSAVAQRPANAARGPLLKTIDAAKYLAISARQVQYLSSRGELPVIQIAGSTRYSQGDLDDFVDRCRQRGGRG